MAAPTSRAISFKKTLANTEPSTHGTWRKLISALNMSASWVKVDLLHSFADVRSLKRSHLEPAEQSEWAGETRSRISGGKA